MMPIFVHSSWLPDLIGDTNAGTITIVRTPYGETQLITGEAVVIETMRFIPTSWPSHVFDDIKVERDPRDPRRWFDPFRTPAAITRPPRQALAARMWRPRARADALQRRRHKRKQFLEAIRA